MNPFVAGPCPHCEGSGRSIALVNARGGCREMSIGCSTCHGAGELSGERADELNGAAMMRVDRITRGLSLSEEAARRGMTPQELSRLEHAR